MFSSQLALAVPRFLWRGRWFWGAWLLVFLLPFTREEARLHFVGSRFFSDLYGQPWQEHWISDDAPPPGLSPLERAVWSSARGQNYAFSYSGNGTDPAATAPGRLSRQFPHEKWLHAFALQQSLGWGSLGWKPVGGGGALAKWARQGERVDPQNAFYPLIMAKILGDSGRKDERAAALERAARGSFYDDGTSLFKQVALRAAQKVGVATWDEKWRIWSRTNDDWYIGSRQLDQLLKQFESLSESDIAAAGKRKSPTFLRSALKRSNAVMRVSLLFQKAPCGANKWDVGAQWARSAWQVARPLKTFGVPPYPTAAEFVAFARAQGSGANVRLAQKCAARMRMLIPSLRRQSLQRSGALFSESEAFWADANGPIGFGVLGFGFHLLVWWWSISLFSWRAVGRESKRSERVSSSAVVIAGTLLAFGLLIAMVLIWAQSSATVRRGPPIGQAEVCGALGLFAFFAPPLLLALWSVVRTVRRNRKALELPARAQLEMNLAPLEAFVLGRATGTFLLATLGLGVGFSILWGYLSWQGLKGYDWLRFLWPGVSTRVVDPIFTSLDSPVMPAYCAVGVILIALLWAFSWRYGTDPQRRPIFHDALRAWKEGIGCALTLTVWVYLAVLMACHFSGEVFSRRLDVVAKQGEGALVRGF